MSFLDTLMFWKHKQKEEVIKQECYDKLPDHRKVDYVPSNLQPTHIVEQVDRTSDDDDGILISTIATVAAIEMLEADAPISGPDFSGYDAPDSSNDFQGFDGGSSGGAGASGDWSSDNSSYDSGGSDFGGSSFDSGGSDFGGSSFDSGGSNW